MNGANAVQASVVVLSVSAGSLTVAFQGSNDLENWAAISSTGSIGLGFSSPSASGIAWHYVRLTYLLSTSATAVLSVTVSTAQLG